MKPKRGASSRRDFLKKSVPIGTTLAGSSSFRSLAAFQASGGRTGRKGQTYPDQRKKYKDSKTGATVWQLTDTPGKWTEVLYFTNRTVTPDSRHLIYISNRASEHGMPARGGRGEGGVKGCDLFKMDLRTGESMQLTEGANIEKDSPDISADGTEVYFVAEGNSVRSVNLESLKEREIARFDPKFAMHHAVSASSDKKVLVCHQQLEPRKTLGYRWAPWASRDAILTIRLDNLQRRTLIDGNTPLGHLAVCPTDPNLLLYSHHSPIYASQRAWLIQMDGTNGRPVFPQRLGEGIGHEIWGPSGKTVYMTVYGGRQPQGMWVTNVDGSNEHCVLA